MSIVKVFVCSKFTGNPDCHYAVAAESDEYVVESAAKHMWEEHGFEDTPELRERILSSLITAEIPS